MNAPLFLLLAAVSADPELPTSVFRTSSPVFEAALRGQSPSTYDEPPVLDRSADDQALTAPQGAPAYAPIGPGIPPGADPFLGQPPPGMFDPAYDSSLTFSAVGPQPYRFGWSSRYDFGYLPYSGTSGGLGDFQILEANGALRHVSESPWLPGFIFAVTPEFNYRSWTGPQFIDLPASVYRFAGDMELSTPANAPWSMQLGFTPAIVSDLHAPLNRDGFNFDGRGVLFYRASPELQLAFGAMYLNRVRDQVIPYAGVVWTPNDRWEFRLMYPKSRISYFLGNIAGAATWIYGGIEYNIEAYEIGLAGPSGDHEKIQIEDYRALIGLRTDSCGVASFIEGGWVFDRDVGFKHGTPGFDINTGFIGRLGIRF